MALWVNVAGDKADPDTDGFILGGEAELMCDRKTAKMRRFVATEAARLGMSLFVGVDRRGGGVRRAPRLLTGVREPGAVLHRTPRGAPVAEGWEAIEMAVTSKAENEILAGVAKDGKPGRRRRGP